MPYWEIILDKDKEILGRYNQEYFTEQKIGEIIKKLYEQQIKQVLDYLFLRSHVNSRDFNSRDLKSLKWT